MSDVGKILIQLDTDPQCSTFDAVVAIDSGAEHLLRHSQVTEDQVTDLVHGAMFTRSPSKLKSTAIFVGGSNVELADRLYQRVLKTFFGPVQVSVAMDASGCNTTSAAAVQLGIDALGATNETGPASALVLGSTGAVGRRITQLLLQRGFQVWCHSRTVAKAQSVIDSIRTDKNCRNGEAKPTDAAKQQLTELAGNCPLVFNAGAAGVQFFDDDAMKQLTATRGVLVDLNAVPPSGFAELSPTMDALLGQRHGIGALTVGNLKMKLHREVIRQCFQANDRHFSLPEIFQLLQSL